MRAVAQVSKFRWFRYCHRDVLDDADINNSTKHGPYKHYLCIIGLLHTANIVDT